MTRRPIIAFLFLLSSPLAFAGTTMVIRREVPSSGTPAATCKASSDTFTEASTGDINLSAGTPDLGTWQGAAAGTGMFLIDRTADVLKTTATTTVYVTFTDAIAGSSVTIYAKGAANNTATGRVGVCGLYSAEMPNYTGYESRFDQAGKLDFRKSGVQVSSTTMATVLGSYANTTEYSLKMVISDIGGAGQLIRVFVNDKEATVLRTSDTTFTSGYGGVIMNQAAPRITEAAIICP